MRDVARPIIFALAVAALNAALHYARLCRVEQWLYRDRLKCLYVVARSLFLLLLTCSAWL